MQGWEWTLAGGEHRFDCACEVALLGKSNGAQPLLFAEDAKNEARRRSTGQEPVSELWVEFIAAHVTAVHLGQEPASVAAEEISAYADIARESLPCREMALLLSFLMQKPATGSTEAAVLEAVQKCWSTGLQQELLRMDGMVDCIRKSLTSSDLRAVAAAAWIVQRSSHDNVAAAALFALPEDLLCAAKRLDVTARRNALVAIANVCFAYPEVQGSFRSLSAASAVKKLLPAASNVGVSAADATAKAAIDAANHMHFTDRTKAQLVHAGFHGWAITFLQLANAKQATTRACCNLLRGIKHVAAVTTAMTDADGLAERLSSLAEAGVLEAKLLLEEWEQGRDAELAAIFQPVNSPPPPMPADVKFAPWRARLLAAALPMLHDAYLAQCIGQPSMHLQLVTTSRCKPPERVLVRGWEVDVKVWRRGQWPQGPSQWSGRSWRGHSREKMSRHDLTAEEARVGAKLIERYADDLFASTSNLSAILVDGSRYKGGSKVREACIALYVRHKGTTVDCEAQLPTHLSAGGVTMATDVREGELMRQSKYACRPLSPLVIGLAINGSGHDNSHGGTLGGIATKDNSVGLLTAAHCVADGAAIYQPAYLDHVDENADGDDDLRAVVSTGEGAIVARDEDVVVGGVTVTVDAAFLPTTLPVDHQAFCITSALPWQRANLEPLVLRSIATKRLGSNGAAPLPRKDVWKIGMTTGLTHGELCACAAPLLRDLHRYACCDRTEPGYALRNGGEAPPALVRGQLLVTQFSAMGDSGALVFTSDGTGGAVAVGLLLGGLGDRSVATPIAAVLERLGCALLQQQ